MTNNSLNAGQDSGDSAFLAGQQSMDESTGEMGEASLGAVMALQEESQDSVLASS